MTITTTTSSIKNCRGFTLIELLVVMGIISSLIAVALPRYASYRASAFDSRAEIDLRSVAMAEEAYFLENDAYLPCSGESCALLPGIKKLSTGVELTVAVRPTGFTGTASHSKGTGKTFTWDSDLGGFTR
jgi:prepilin-type N-terminal cleavage/methylation domain-containing protein